MLANAAASSQTPLPAPPSVTRSITMNAIAGSAAPVRSRKLALYHDFKKNARPLSMLASLISFSLIPRLTDRCLCIFGSISSSTEGNRKENIQFVCSGKQEDEAMIPMINLNVHLFAKIQRIFKSSVRLINTSNTQFKANRTDIKNSRSVIFLSC